MNTPELRVRLTEGGLDQALAMLYGAERVAQQKARYGALLDRHEAQFGTKEEGIYKIMSVTAIFENQLLTQRKMKKFSVTMHPGWI